VAARLQRLTPTLLLHAYASGIFPMAEHQDSSEIYWVDPSRRGIMPLDGFHMSRSLKKAILAEHFDIRFDTDFAAVVAGCADRPETWINDVIFQIYADLHAAGHAHSMEVWEGSELVGGVYGVAQGAAFFGESMFSRRTNASKIALAWLVHRLSVTGFTLFDTQFVTPHLASLGGIEIDRADYLDRLEQAIDQRAHITRLPAPQTAAQVVQRMTQTS